MNSDVHTEPCYTIADRWRHDCLIADGSLFTPGTSIWTPAAAEDFYERFVLAPDPGQGTFLEKLEVQLSGAPRDTVLLASELLYAHMLGVVDIRLRKKRDLVEAPLAWLDDSVEMPEDLAPALDGGIASVGVAYKTHRYRQVRQISSLVRTIKALTPAERRRALEDPWSFKALLEESGAQGAGAQRNMLLHLFFPTVFESSISQRHKRRIAEHYAEYIPGDEDDIDRQLLAIRQALQQEQEARVDFYSPERRQEWLDVEEPASTPPATSGRPQRPIEAVLQEHYPDELQRRVAAHELLATATLARKHGEQVWSSRIARGNRVRINVGRMQALVLREGEVVYSLDGDRFNDARYSALHPFLRREQGHYRSRPDAVDVVLPIAEVADLAPLVRELHDPLVESLARTFRRTPYRRSHNPDIVPWITRWLKGHESDGSTADLSELEAQLYLPEGALETIVTLLEDKGQVILCGPPGTGKTFVARQLADWITGDPARVEKVQLHPSYAYEDFVEGYRPTLVDGQPGFALKEGPLKRIAHAARLAPDQRHVLLVDEINRGNLAKVFGELYYLLEYRDDALRLPYSEEPFALPHNLYLIGTMNTADRSIALVDLALRRRFHFVEFFPDRDPIRGVLRGWLEVEAPDMLWVADVVDRANEQLADRDAAIGPSYFMRPELDEETLERIWEHSVLPYLAEQLYGESERLRGFDLSALRSEVEGRPE